MTFVSSQDVFFIISACSILAVAVYLCKVLHEAAILIHQTNEVVEETREKVSRIEVAVTNISDKFKSFSQYLGFITEGGKQLMSYLHRREEKETLQPKKKGK